MCILCEICDRSTTRRSLPIRPPQLRLRSRGVFTAAATLETTKCTNPELLHGRKTQKGLATYRSPQICETTQCTNPDRRRRVDQLMQGRRLIVPAYRLIDSNDRLIGIHQTLVATRRPGRKHHNDVDKQLSDGDGGIHQTGRRRTYPRTELCDDVDKQYSGGDGGIQQTLWRRTYHRRELCDKGNKQLL